MSDKYKELILSLASAQKATIDLERKYALALQEIKAAKNKAAKLEREIRDYALAEFYETGERKFHDALEVRMVSVRTYGSQTNINGALRFAPDAFVVDSEQLRLHAQEVVPILYGIAPELLTLDEKRLGEIAKTPEGNWVEVDETRKPTVYLSSKLGGFLIESEFGATDDREEDPGPDQGRD